MTIHRHYGSEEVLSAERDIITRLVAFLGERGFVPVCARVHGRGVPVSTAEEIIEKVQSLASELVLFRKDGGRLHGVRLLSGYGDDIICDWSPGIKEVFSKAVCEFLDQ